MWTLAQARSTYALEHWGEGYFDVGEDGHLVVRPRRDGRSLDLHEVATRLRGAGLSLPVLVRFDDILHDRVEALIHAFGAARERFGYRGGYTAVYPIKVNQQRRVVERIVASGGADVGLEAGSKPELMAVLAAAPPGATVICNGYKDRQYIRLALIGRRMGLDVHIVIEKLSELPLIAEAARALGIRPRLGLRVRLASLAGGKWQNTGGEKSKFGLHARQVLAAAEGLREAGLADCLRLLHCHLGSQLANIRDIQRGLHEAARYYGELRRLGLPVEAVDVGGGLGVDYEGTGSRSDCSVNYSLEEYANNVVQALAEVCEREHLPQPALLTESGRAMTAHHAVLVTNVIDIEHAPGSGAPERPAEDDPAVVRHLWQVLERVSARTALECHHDAEHWLAEARALYLHGVLDLPARARAEALYYAVCHRVRPLLKAGHPAHREVLDDLNEKLADKYFLNFSVFRSVPDVWAIDQIFPIVPLHRLDDPPTRRAILQDLTCDSDGRIEHYVDGEGVETTLPLHPYRRGEDYLLGIFMVGAYQEILGDVHNLFGTPHAVDLTLDERGGYRISEPEAGGSVDGLLEQVHFDIADMKAVFADRLSGLPEEERAALARELEAGLAGYTYLE